MLGQSSREMNNLSRLLSSLYFRKCKIISIRIQNAWFNPVERSHLAFRISNLYHVPSLSIDIRSFCFGIASTFIILHIAWKHLLYIFTFIGDILETLLSFSDFEKRMKKCASVRIFFHNFVVLWWTDFTEIMRSCWSALSSVIYFYIHCRY